MTNQATVTIEELFKQFVESCPKPTPEQILEWASRYPMHAAFIETLAGVLNLDDEPLKFNDEFERRIYENCLKKLKVFSDEQKKI